MGETASDSHGSGPCQNRAAPSDTFSDKNTAPAHYGNAVIPKQTEVTMILIMGTFICNYNWCADRKNQSEHSIRSAAIVGWSLMAGRIIVFCTCSCSEKVVPLVKRIAAARRRQGGRLTRPRKNTRLPRGETMLASFLTLARFRPLSAVLFGASAGGDAPHRTPPQRRPLPPAFRCTSEHSTVQERGLPADLRLAP